jgi:hypothetical protein
MKLTEASSKNWVSHVINRTVSDTIHEMTVDWEAWKRKRRLIS